MSEPEPEEHGADREQPPPFRELFLIAAVVIALVGGGAWWASRPSGLETPRRPVSKPGASAFAGTRACAECHPGEAAQFSRSGHARTLRPAGERALATWLDGRTARDPDFPEAVWTFHRRDRRLLAERTDGQTGQSDRLELEFAFGSGAHATTFVSLNGPRAEPPRGFEHRLTYFARDATIEITPGQRLETATPGCGPLGRSLSGFETRKCFECHATRISSEGPETLDLATLIPNVSCERCHGPGKDHIEAARRGETTLTMPFGPERWTSDSQMRMCGSCHRLPEYIPKDELKPENSILVRFQPVGLMQSRCYTASRGALSCVTCHDPHGRVSHDGARYEASCRSCHQGAPQTTCTQSRETGCIGCHMPAADSGHGMQFTDHWIRRQP